MLFNRGLIKNKNRKFISLIRIKRYSFINVINIRIIKTRFYLIIVNFRLKIFGIFNK